MARTNNIRISTNWALWPYTSTDLIEGKVNWDTCVFVSEERYKQDTNIIVKNGDVLVSKDGTIGKVAVVSNLQYPTTLNSGVFVIRTKNNMYTYCYFPNRHERSGNSPIAFMPITIRWSTHPNEIAPAFRITTVENSRSEYDKLQEIVRG